MKGHGNKFGRKKEAAIAALLATRTQAEAAKAVGIDLTTLKRWMRLPEFIEEYRRARWEVAEQAYARVQQGAPAAATVLMKLMVDATTPASARIRAALGVFALSREALDLDIETRVAALEEAAQQTRESGRNR
jgi:DNA invertase Pin-like site-specific DNA recombinase